MSSKTTDTTGQPWGISLGMDEEAARDLERKIEREFSLWADSTACDLERLDNFYELQQLAFLNWLMSGDVIATLLTIWNARSSKKTVHLPRPLLT